MNVCIVGPSMNHNAVMDYIRASGKSVSVLVVDDNATEPRIEAMSLDSHVRQPPKHSIPILEFNPCHQEAYPLTEMHRTRHKSEPWRSGKKDSRFK